jgi:hypothetical protein
MLIERRLVREMLGYLFGRTARPPLPTRAAAEA